MRDIEAEFDSTYGQPRMRPELRGRGFCVNHKRVERLMRANGIAGVHKAPKIRTTIPAEDNPPMPDLIGRNFNPGEIDVAWVGDIDRHEAFFNLAMVKGHRCQLVAAG
jgi:transposase InsO family protein